MDTKPVNKSTAAILALVTALAGAGGTAAITMQAAAVPELTATIKGQTEAPIGTLVTLKAESPAATQLRWYPSTDNTTHACEDGGSLVATSSTAGTREYVLFAANATSSIVTVHRVTFGAAPPPPTKPEPCPPCDEPKPTPPTPPTPTPPTPTPTPPTPPKPVPTYGLAASVPEWLTKVPASARAQSVAIAAVYKSIGQQASDGDFKTIAEVEAASGAAILKLVTDGSIAATAWRPFGESLNAAFTALRAIGRITTPEQYGEAMLEVGEAL